MFSNVSLQNNHNKCLYKSPFPQEGSVSSVCTWQTKFLCVYWVCQLPHMCKDDQPAIKFLGVFAQFYWVQLGTSQVDLARLFFNQGMHLQHSFMALWKVRLSFCLELKLRHMP